MWMGVFEALLVPGFLFYGDLGILLVLQRRKAWLRVLGWKSDSWRPSPVRTPLLEQRAYVCVSRP